MGLEEGKSNKKSLASIMWNLLILNLGGPKSNTFLETKYSTILKYG
jgi:hypothetical protein